MTRTSRHDFLNRNAPRVKRVKLNHTFKKQWAEQKAREIKKQLIAAGHLTDPATARPKYDYHWGIENRVGGVVQANTKGEARARIKTVLGLKKSDTLPAVIKIVRVIPSASASASVAACQIGGVPAGSDGGNVPANVGSTD